MILYRHFNHLSILMDFHSVYVNKLFKVSISGTNIRNEDLGCNTLMHTLKHAYHYHVSHTYLLLTSIES